ncbi:hypothetical protein [Vibrio sp. Hal054]|uniref:hypothetical protein n=1 Tax=Vibrio sp. Hal054 TaxID=3035158 RepID=UPI00301C86BF
MPTIYVSESEMEAFRYFEGIVHALSESNVTEEWLKEYDEKNAIFYSFERKFRAAQESEDKKRLVASTLKKIKQLHK